MFLNHFSFIVTALPLIIKLIFCLMWSFLCIIHDRIEPSSVWYSAWCEVSYALSMAESSPRLYDAQPDVKLFMRYPWQNRALLCVMFCLMWSFLYVIHDRLAPFSVWCSAWCEVSYALSDENIENIYYHSLSVQYNTIQCYLSTECIQNQFLFLKDCTSKHVGPIVS